MSLNNFIPQVWAAQLLTNLNNAHVYGQPGVINRDYEGQISQAGDTVKINSIGRVTIGNYSKNTDINDPETLDDGSQILRIDQQKYFNFFIDDVDKIQQTPKVMGSAMDEAAWGLRDISDKYIGGFYTDIASNNFLGSDVSPIVPTAASAYEKLVDLGVILDESNTPTTGRWAIVPPWFEGLLLKDDRFVKSGTGTSDSVLRNGVIGEAAGFTILKSNNVPNISGAKYKIIAGHAVAWTFAEQIVEVEGYRPEKRFGDAMKGLHVYGAKVTRPNNLAVLVATKS